MPQSMHSGGAAGELPDSLARPALIAALTAAITQQMALGRGYREAVKRVADEEQLSLLTVRRLTRYHRAAP